MLKSMCRITVVVFAMLAAAHVYAQDAYVIDAAGTATVDAAPATVMFQLEILPGGGSAADLLQKAAEFETAVRTQIQDRGMTPTQLAFSGLNYTHPQQLGPNASAFLRFPTTPCAAGENADEKYAALLDQLAEITAAVSARLHPAKFEVNEPDQVEAAAVARALEKAYLPAKAAADIMNARIISVGNVSVGSVRWSDTDSDPADYNIRRVTCTATVTAGYLYVPGP